MSAIEREVAEPHDASRTPDKTQLARYYHQMLAIRRMEEALAKAYALRKFGGFLHLYIGQEAVAVGALATLKPDDYVIRTERFRRTSPQVIVNLFARWYEILGFNGCSSHSGRRTFITNAARKISTVDGSLRDVQMLAGHANLRTTQRYIEPNASAQTRVVQLI